MQYGSSLIEQFVIGHDVAAVLRELVQNEYDAGGSAMEIAFWEDHLSIKGNGKGFDRSGWRRLSVILGTGTVESESEEIAEKKNGIGSKNFGLRSLFLFGDQILVRSNGRFTILDAGAGTLAEPEPDTTWSAEETGVHIQVPYRTQPNGKLRPFTKEAEQDGFLSLEANLPLALKRLAGTNKARGLTQVEIRSARLGISIKWAQIAKPLKAGSPYTALTRRITMNRTDLDGSEEKSSFTETEFSATFRIPAEHRGISVPSYFLCPGGRVRVSVSLSGKRRDRNRDPGLLYYPIGIPKAYTGTCYSVCAPFEMNENRSALVPCSSNPWNRWLLESCAELLVGLLPSHLFSHFGAAAYASLLSDALPTEDVFIEKLRVLLKERKCWPTSAREGRNRALLSTASECVVPEPMQLCGILGLNRELAQELGLDSKAREAAKRFGVYAFDRDHLVSFRCAGKDSKPKWFPKEKIPWYSTNYPENWKNLTLQKRFAEALTAVSRSLSPDQQKSLRTAPTTLRADGELGCVGEMLQYTADAVATGVPLQKLLHPALQEYPEVRRFAKKFDPRTWMVDVARRASTGGASEDELAGLRKIILETGGKLPRVGRDEILKAPVLKDHTDRWCAPRDLIAPNVPGAKGFLPVLHLPEAEVARSRDLMKRLGIRRKLSGRDLVRYAQFAAFDAQEGSKAEALLWLNHRLITPSIAKELGDIPFIRVTDDTLARAFDLYVPTPAIRALLGASVRYAAGKSFQLYELIGARTTPTRGDLLRVLQVCRGSGVAPPCPASLYGELAKFGKSEDLFDQPILWTDRGYISPADAVLNQMFERLFREVCGIIPHRDEVVRSYKALGAAWNPTERHWVRLLKHLATAVGKANRVTSRMRSDLERTYEALSHLPADFPADLPCLLTADTKLASLADLRASTFVWVDDQSLAQAVIRHKIPLLLADQCSWRAFKLLQACGIRMLSSVVRSHEPSYEMKLEPPQWFKLTKFRKHLVSRALRSAAKSLLLHLQLLPAKGLDKRLRDVFGQASRCAFVASLSRDYRHGKERFKVPLSYWMSSSGLFVCGLNSWTELLDIVAQAVSAELIRSDLERESVAARLLNLLRCSDEEEMKGYLSRHNIPWIAIAARRSGPEDAELPFDEGLEPIEEQLADSLSTLLLTGPGREGRSSKQQFAQDPEQRKPDKAEDLELPDIGSVTLTKLSPSEKVVRKPAARPVSNTGGWRPRTAKEREKDELLGRRAEELIYLVECRRAREESRPISSVIWVSQRDPGADHDIRLVQGDGQETYIEVKATAGRDGHFTWSSAELMRAMELRDRYVLVRVYEAASITPSYKTFPDPVGLWGRDGMSMSIGELRAQVEPMD